MTSSWTWGVDGGVNYRKNALLGLATKLDLLCGGPFCCSFYLFESLQDFLPLAEMPKEQMQRSGHQRRVVVHSEVQQDPQEGSAAVIIQVQWRVLLTVCTHRTDQLRLEILIMLKKNETERIQKTKQH